MIQTASGTERWTRGLQLTTYTPWPKQCQFHKSPAKYRLFGGAAGPGKSVALLMEAIQVAASDYDGVNTLLLRRTFPELESSLILTFRRMVPKELYRRYNTQKQMVEWHNGSVTKFGYCKAEKDIWQYQGGEWIFVGWDELTQFTLSQWQTMTGWNRSPQGPGRMAGATNPIGVGRAWVNALWIEKQPAPGMDAHEYNPDDYEFIPGTYLDNPLYAQDEDYRRSLEALPAHLRAALLEGKWDILAGVYFDIFDRATMVCRAEEIGMADWWPRWVGVDWGFEHPAAVYWNTQSPDGVTYTYRELVCRHTAPVDLAREVVGRSRGSEGQEKIQAIYLSPDAFARRTDADTIADQMNGVFREERFPMCSPADNDRVGGAMLMYQLLRDGRWLIAENCSQLIDVLPTMVRDEKNVEDVLKMDGDDPYDAARYSLKTRLHPRNAPLGDQIANKITAADPTIRALQARKAMVEQKRRATPRFHRRRRRRSPSF